MLENGDMGNEPCDMFVTDCHVRGAVELIAHTWDPLVLSALRLGPTRRNILLLRIAGMSDKALTQALRRLLARGLVEKIRETGGGATYELSPLGNSFVNGPLLQLAHWASDHQAALANTE